MKKKTRRNGRFSEWLRLDNRIVEAAADVSLDGRRSLQIRLSSTQPETHGVDCKIVLLQRTGLSVISDIDDTIKVSAVGNRRELLLNTFVRSFRSVEGMSDVYQHWYRAGADFHYVSSSPWQLFESLQQMQAESEFPPGTMHLRNFRLRDQFIKKVMMIRRKGKAMEIKRLVRNMPSRKFVLVGDSGEKDPEIYQKICRRFPDQIKGMFIREVEGHRIDFERLAKMRRAAGDNYCSVFARSADLERMADGVFARYGRLAVAN